MVIRSVRMVANVVSVVIQITGRVVRIVTMVPGWDFILQSCTAAAEIFRNCTEILVKSQVLLLHFALE